ncbi:hypothetical protein Desku_0935 [Desulfofundulus kuznetsovii DSM 6115]|uniref:Uncharacterized protein n=1 Tax=Desulfofundulus kuznetsovii (strain DSM 6115 / VKM B-1805 / 17) TaxID=760568 RepID=A0AAU8P8J0_DESK7|nr:hypothetical protein Desku_0935 [Desulfofundulus kuznetsovii DSM 6115]
MYFPILRTISRYKIDDLLYKKLDVWLGTRRKATRNFLSPLQFSIDSGIDEDTAMLLFAICTQPDINLLKVRYMVECPYCYRKLAIFNNPMEIPEQVYCPEDEADIPVKKDNIVIWFELLSEPQDQPI